MKNGLKIIVVLMLAIIGIGILYLTGCFRKEPSLWTITQYASASGGQAMIYTIKSDDGRFAVIDGGWEADADGLRKVITENGNHITDWIITHPHPDHVGAFNVIMAEPGEIAVDHIYVTPVNYDRYKETAQDYDGYESCETYRGIIEKLDNVYEVHENDEIDIIGLKMKALHVWNEEVDELPDHLCNDGSIMFRLDGKCESMLFCADVQSEMESYIIDRHKDELNVDYVQTGHHGNWGLSTDFYKHTTPKAVFFDSTDALLTPGDLGFDAGELKTYFEEQGALFYNYGTAPNAITLK